MAVEHPNLPMATGRMVLRDPKRLVTTSRTIAAVGDRVLVLEGVLNVVVVLMLRVGGAEGDPVAVGEVRYGAPRNLKPSII